MKNRHFSFLVIFASLTLIMIVYSCSSTPKFTKETLRKGHDIYHEKTCISCHGDDGRGLSPDYPDFTKATSRLKVSEDELINNVIQGIPAHDKSPGMPANAGRDDLTKDEIRLAILYMRTMFYPNYPDIQKGHDLYHANPCASCHGDEGKGLGAGFPDFSKKDSAINKPLNPDNAFES